MPRLSLPAAFLLGALLPATTLAQTPTPTTTPIPEATPNPPGQSLSEKLDKSNGVIQPKPVDPAMQKPAPTTHDPDVIVPPGTNGGADAPKAK